MAQRALERAIHHVTRRRQFGAPLSEQQIVRAYLAEMATELDASRLLVARAAHRRDHGEPASTEAAMAKMYATEAAQRIIDLSVQLHGGMGVALGTEVEELYREIRRCIFTNYCEALDQRHRPVTCQLWDRDALDEPGVSLTDEGRRRLVAPSWRREG